MSTTISPISLDTISLYYKEGTSDKEYHLAILGNEEKGFQVEYRYGRRGSKLTTKFKNKVPVDYAKARAIFNDNMNSQLRDGYTLAEGGTPYIGTENQGKVSGVLPQLLNFIDEEEIQKYINDDAWVMQEKKDGVRQMVKKKGKILEGVNKKGLVVSLPENVVDEIKLVCGVPDTIIDGELVGEVYWMFDILSYGVHSFTDKSYSERLEAIQEDFDTLSIHPEAHFRLVPTAIGKSSKKAMFAKLKKENAEGVVFKKLDSIYKPGRPNSGGNQLKFKFKGSATVRCKYLNDKNSFMMEMMSAGDWIEVGNCTYFPTILVPTLGRFYEIEYLYAYPGGSLFQPTLKEHRTDVDEGDCGVSQLKCKQGSVEDDDDAGS